jgi:hypothetical protein
MKGFRAILKFTPTFEIANFQTSTQYVSSVFMEPCSRVG